MTEALLAGTRVVDLAGEPAAMAGRILADLGAAVILVEPPDGLPLRALPRRFLAWGAGKSSVAVDGPDDPRLDELLAMADAVIETPGFPGATELDPGRAPAGVPLTSGSWHRAGTCSPPATPIARPCAAASRPATRTSAPRPRSRC